MPIFSRWQLTDQSLMVANNSAHYNQKIPEPWRKMYVWKDWESLSSQVLTDYLPYHLSIIYIFIASELGSAASSTSLTRIPASSMSYTNISMPSDSAFPKRCRNNMLSVIIPYWSQVYHAHQCGNKQGIPQTSPQGRPSLPRLVVPFDTLYKS